MRLDDEATAPRWFLLAALGLMALLQTLLLYREFNIGELAGVIPWDDCSVLDLALLRLARASEADSILAMGLKAQDLAPHSPVADYVSLVAMLFTGGEIWSAYALNILLPGLALVFVGLALRRRHPFVAAAVLLLLVFQPLTVFALTNLKADWKGGVLAAGAMFLFFDALETRSRARWFQAALLLGLAVLCKLTAFYVPPLALATLFLFHLSDIVQVRLAGGERFMAGGAVRWGGAVLADLSARARDVALQAALIVGPYAFFFAFGAVSHFNILRYIQIALSEDWLDGLTWPQRMANYGPLLNPAWGPLGWLFPLCILASIAAFVRWRKFAFLQPIVLGGVVAGLFFLPLAAAKTSNWEFGAAMIGIFLGLALTMVVRLGAISRIAGAVVLVAALVGVLTASFNSYRREITPEERMQRFADVEVYHRVVEDVVRLRRSEDVPVDVYYEHPLIPYPNLGLYYFERTRRRLNTYQVQEMPTGQAGGLYQGSGDFALVLKPARGDTPSNGFQSTADVMKNQGAVQRYLASLQDLRLAAEYPLTDGTLQLWARVPPPAAPGTP